VPIHDAVACRFPLLDGIASLQEAMADPEKDRRVRAFMEPPLDPPAVVPTRDLAVEGPHGPVPVRVYGDPADPGAGTGRPALLWIHGGAFMFGDLDMPEADWTAREVCARTGAVVVSVDYRLAVGGVHHPVPLDDCVAATRWLRDSAAELGVDPDRITVGGGSAGGNLAVAAVLRIRDEDGWLPAALLPVYPVLHPALPEPSPEVAALLDEVPPALRFTPQGTAGINANYLGGQAADGYSFPALAELSGLAPTVLVTAEYDDLRTTGEAFVELLRAAGVDVRHVQADGMLHGFLNLSPTLEPVDAVLDLMSELVATSTTLAPMEN
jgi:acetyl esterase/lipase